MCKTENNTTKNLQTPVDNPEEDNLDTQIKEADRELQLALIRQNTEFNRSVAGQMTRQFEAVQRIAIPWSKSTIVPTSYRDNIGNCVIAVDLAFRMNLNPLTVMQNLYVVNGNPSWSSKFLVATINTCGRFSNLRYRKRHLGKVGKIKYNVHEWVEVDKQKKKTLVTREGDFSEIDNWECVAYASEKATGETLEGDAVTIEMAIREGWYTKDGSKWVTMPMLMLSYRAAAFWQRIYAPEVAMGFRTVEEEEDVVDLGYGYEDLSADAPKKEEEKVNVPRSVAVENAKEKLRARAAAPSGREAKKTETANLVNETMP